MADKSFGIKRLNLIGAPGTPNITSPNNLNINAETVSISTDLSVGGEVVSNLIISDLHKLGIGSTAPTEKLDVFGDANISGTLGVGTLSATNLSVSSNATFSNGVEFDGEVTYLNSVSFQQSDVVFQNLKSTTAEIETLSVAGIAVTSINSSGVITATSFHTGAEGFAIRVTADTISGPSEIVIDPAGIGDNTGSLRIKGDLYVDGEEFIVDSSRIELADFNVGIASTVSTNSLLDGAGIGIGSTSIRKTLTYSQTSDSLKSSENFDLSDGKAYKIGGTEVLNSVQLTIPNLYSSGIGTIDNLNTTNLVVSGLSTFNGIGTFTSDLYVGGVLHAPSLTIEGGASLGQDLSTRNLQVTGVVNVSGASTFASNVDINSDLNVDGHTELDNVNISGIVTVFDLDVDGHTELDNVNISGVTTFVGLANFNSDIDVDGHTELDNLNVSGVSTFAGSIDANGNLDLLGDLNVDGHTELDQLNVSGVSTFSGAVDANGGLDVTGHTELDNVNAGIITATKFDGDLNALGKTYYVATTGSDSNSGNNINEPYLTIAQALSVATNGDIINVSAGVYEETCPLVVPRGVTVKGAGLRATTIRPTTATKQENVFHLNDISTVEDFTVRGSYFDTSADTGYAFAYAPGIAITTRSPYIQRVTVLNTGSTVTVDDPYGYDTADSPPTSYIAGAGAKVDGSLVASNSLEAGMLFNEVTFFTPNNKGTVLTNGARAEYLNCFHYFASQAIVGIAGTVGIGGTADARLKFTTPGVTLSVDDVVKLYESGSVVAVGTITEYNDPYARIEGRGFGTFTSVGIGSTQDVRFYQSDGTTQTGIASAIAWADYTMFGAEMRSVCCAFEYGTQAVVADGAGVKLRLFATNFNHVGSGKNITNDPTLTIQANEVIELNDGQVSYVSIDQDGDFRVGDALYINQETGNVSFAATTYDLEVVGNMNVTDGSNTSTLTPTSLTVGNLSFSGNEIESTTGDININPAGSNETNVTGNLNVTGILTAAVLQVAAVQKGDTSIAIDDTGSDGTIRLNTDGLEGLRVTNDQKVGINSSSPAYRLDVQGDINTSTDVKINGVSVLTSASDEAIALAIALG
jgi:cytoskeletal protein CcmA (bactofilin family)